MYGDDINLFDEVLVFDKPWRTMTWKSEKRTELMEGIKTFKPTVSSVSQARVLLVGPVGAGKSSFFNSVNSVFRGYVTSQVKSGFSRTSLTTQIRACPVKTGPQGTSLPFIMYDTMGLEDSRGAGLDVHNISSILKDSGLENMIHCVAYVIDASTVYSMSRNLEEKLDTFRKQVNLMGVPQLVLLTKVDEACPLVKRDVRNVYKSGYIKELMQKVSTLLGVPLSCVVPVRNYCEELELDSNCDILLLSTIIQMLRFADDHLLSVTD